MTDLMPEQQQAQYAAIELLYSEGKWNEVLRASEALLTELPRLQGYLVRLRLELVIGHTLLYGLADLDGAEARYRSVLSETEEPVLREIAEQGLVRCGKQRQVVVASDGSQTLGSAPLPETTKPERAAETRTQATAAQADVEADATTTAACGEKLPMQSQPPEEACLTSLASEAASAVATMPWEVSAISAPSAVSPPGGASGAAMPWLAELGMEPVSRAAETTSAEETLALLRDPDALSPMPAQVMEKPATKAQEWPEAEQAEPPLSREEMRELARGLLEVVLG